MSLADSIRQTASIARCRSRQATRSHHARARLLLLGSAGARRRSSCSRSSGVNSSPKSSASNTWRISISTRRRHRVGAALDPLDRLVHRLHLPQPEAGDQLLRLGERPVDHGPLVAENLTRAPFELGWQALAREHDAGLHQLLVELAHYAGVERADVKSTRRAKLFEAARWPRARGKRCADRVVHPGLRSRHEATSRTHPRPDRRAGPRPGLRVGAHPARPRHRPGPGSATRRSRCAPRSASRRGPEWHERVRCLHRLSLRGRHPRTFQGQQSDRRGDHRPGDRTARRVGVRSTECRSRTACPA